MARQLEHVTPHCLVGVLVLKLEVKAYHTAHADLRSLLMTPDLTGLAHGQASPGYVTTEGVVAGQLEWKL